MATTSQDPSHTTVKSRSPAQTRPMIRITHANAVAINFLIDSNILKESIPRGLVLDYYKGDTFVSLVCLEVRHVPFLGLPIVPRFSELSLRCFVTQEDNPKRKGILFLKRYASSKLGSWVLGNLLPNLYQPLSIKGRHSGTGANEIPNLDYQWRVDDHENRIRVRGRDQISHRDANSKLSFFLSHKTHFQSIHGRTYSYDVTSPEWILWDAAQANFTCDVRRLFGSQYVKPLAARPASVFISPGSKVGLHRPVEI